MRLRRQGAVRTAGQERVEVGRATVEHLRRQGHSLRAIGKAVGVDAATVQRDLAAAG